MSEVPPEKTTTWRDAWNAGPGPVTTKQGIVLGLKGICMGGADIIPGVSGGTIAFITGIYENLLAAIASFDLVLLRRLLKCDLKGAAERAHIRFLIPLLAGIGLAIASMAKLMHHLMHHHPVPTWSLFFGLIAASIIVVSKEIKDLLRSLPIVVLGTLIAWLIVGLIPMETPDASWFIFICGMIAICAMILPGVSGSFLLLILGKYEMIIGAISGLVKPEAAFSSFCILAVFGCGTIVGIAGFSRILKYGLTHYHNMTMCLLTGFMIGGMRKVWPWKHMLNPVAVRGKIKFLGSDNFLPGWLDGEIAFAVGLMIVGFVFVLLLDRMASSERPECEQ